MTHIKPASDPSWADGERRTALLNGLMALHGISIREMAELTNVTYGCANHWCSGKHRTIPTDTLRALMYDVMSREAR